MGALLVIAGMFGLGLGFLMVFAGGMSDAPELGDAYASRGCVMAICGALTIILGAWMLLHHIAG